MPLTFDLAIQINRVSPLIIYKFLVKFESYWQNTVVRIVPKRFYTKSANVLTLTFDPATINQ